MRTSDASAPAAPERTEIRLLFAAPERFLNREITVAGWVRSLRVSKACAFITLNDGSCFQSLQIVIDARQEQFGAAAKLGVGAAILARGVVAESPGAGQDFELHAAQICLEGACPPDYPLQKKHHSFEYLRTVAHLRPRTNTFSAVFRLRSVLAGAIHQYFQERGFVYVQTPVITASDCEGAGEMFQLTTLDLAKIPRTGTGEVDYSRDFFGRAANLTVSGQLNAEAFALAFGKVYAFGPAFRAEDSNTARHAAEFWMLEPEIAFAGLEEDMDLAEDMVKYLIRAALERLPEEMAFFDRFVSPGIVARLEELVRTDFARVCYTEAIEILRRSGESFTYPVSWGIDLQTEHERYLAERYFGRPVFVTDYPKEIKAFYMRLNEDGRTVAAMDLLAPGIGEIIGGSQREERLDVLERRMEELSLPREAYRWYLDLRRYGGARHAGFGLGFERLLMYLSGMSNIRDVIAFPRTVHSAEF